ncbi:hypothetical protein LCGC14_3051300, partial [marine sediment metagenome]
GAYNPILDPILDNKWYHIKLDFETGVGVYKGLAADTFYITIDGIQYGPYPFNNVAPHVDKIYFTCNSAAVYNYYVDAIDYSWDPYYSVGRNVNPTVANMLGQYPGTYSFTNELVYAKDEEIDFVYSIGTGYTANILSSFDGYRKVITSLRTGSYIHYPYDPINRVSGTYEYWIQASSGGIMGLDLFEGSVGYMIIVDYDKDTNKIELYYGDGSGGNINIEVSVSGWAHVKITFDCVTDKFSAWVDGINYIANENFYSDYDADYGERIVLAGSTGILGYYDAISYSWDDNYLIGDNLHYNNFLGSETFENYNQTYPGDYYGTESFDYRTEDDVYYGTYDFRDEADGTSGTSIDFVD